MRDGEQPGKPPAPGATGGARTPFEPPRHTRRPPGFTGHAILGSVAELVYVGTGEAIDPERANTSLLYRGGRTLLLDCGYAVPHALWRIERDPDAIDGVYLSHLHADHAFGLPALCLWMRLRGRRRPLALLGTAATLAGARRILDLGYPGSFHPSKCFPIEAVEVPGDGHDRDWGPLSLASAPSHHKRMANHAVRLSEDGRVRFAYSGDGRPSATTRALFQGVPHLVHECFGLSSEGTPQGHASLDDLVALAADLGVGRLDLLHFDRDQHAAITAAIERLAERVQSPRCMAPRAGHRVEL